MKTGLGSLKSAKQVVNTSRSTAMMKSESSPHYFSIYLKIFSMNIVIFCSLIQEVRAFWVCHDSSRQTANPWILQRWHILGCVKNGLSIKHHSDQCQLLVSNGLITSDQLQSGKPWTLGNFIVELGGIQARSKQTFGIYVQCLSVMMTTLTMYISQNISYITDHDKIAYPHFLL